MQEKSGRERCYMFVGFSACLLEGETILATPLRRYESHVIFGIGFETGFDASRCAGRARVHL